MKQARDYYFKTFKETEFNQDWSSYKELRNSFNSLNRLKMISYFENKEAKDFKSCAKYWQFYSAHIKVKSDKSSNSKSMSITNGSDVVTDSSEIADLFNCFFTSIRPNSSIDYNDCSDFTLNHFNDLKKKNLITTPEKNFSFQPTTTVIVRKLLNELSTTSAAGASGISTKLLKATTTTDKLAILITKLFNLCIKRCYIPNEWKSAVVTPLLKGGNASDVNNYRGISVLPPLAKVFEKLLASQILIYLNINKILFNGQHGFRPGHSCESALHEMISDFNSIRDRGEIGLCLLIDFRKAFDLVDSVLLLNKLFHLGFNNSSLSLIKNYFENRSQTVKVNGCASASLPIRLSIPPGSCLGPLFFILFINDLPFFVNGFKSKLFADDTSLYMASSLNFQT